MNNCTNLHINTQTIMFINTYLSTYLKINIFNILEALKKTNGKYKGKNTS